MLTAGSKAVKTSADSNMNKATCSEDDSSTPYLQTINVHISQIVAIVSECCLAATKAKLSGAFILMSSAACL